MSVKSSKGVREDKSSVNIKIKCGSKDDKLDKNNALKKSSSHLYPKRNKSVSNLTIDKNETSKIDRKSSTVAQQYLKAISSNDEPQTIPTPRKYFKFGSSTRSASRSASRNNLNEKSKKHDKEKANTLVNTRIALFDKTKTQSTNSLTKLETGVKSKIKKNVPDKSLKLGKDEEKETIVRRIKKEIEKIEGQVEEFGEKLRRRRTLSGNYCEPNNASSKSKEPSIKLPEDCIDKPSSSAYSEKSGEDMEEYRKSVLLEVDNILEQMNQDNNFDEDARLEPTKQATEHEEVSANWDDSDEFETYIFDENCSKNYVVEAFNDPGNELVVTVLEISRRTLSLSNDINIESEVNKETSDIVFHTDEETKAYEEVVNKNESIPVYERSPSCPNQPFEPQNYEDVLYENVGFTLQEENLDDKNNTLGSSKTDNENKRVSGYETMSDFDNYKRSTIYSDCSEDNQDEGIVVDLRERRKTICDLSGNVRIEKIGFEPDHDFLKPPDQADFSRSESQRRSIDYIIEEIISTEAKYVKDLEKIVKDYKPFVETLTNKHLIGRACYIFGNVETIWEYAVDFYAELFKNRDSIAGLARTFLQFEKMFNLYPLYSKNKPTADANIKDFLPFLKERQQALGDKLDLSSYLLAPIQRLGKYILFLEKILKQERRKNPNNPDLGIVEKALEMVRNEMRKGNDCIAIDSIKYCPIDLSFQGSFLMREKFLVLKPKKMDCTVFLFEKIVVFTSQHTEDEFSYIDSINLSDLSMAIYEKHPLVFHLNDYTRNKKFGMKKYTYVLEARTSKVKDTWTKEIEKLLWLQLLKVKDEQSHLHDYEGKRYSTKTITEKDGISVSSEGSKPTKEKKTKMLVRKESAKFYTSEC